MKKTSETPTYSIQRSKFEDLSTQQFYLLAKLRQDVFIVEQQSIYSDLDGQDQEAMHYLCWSLEQPDAELIGYARYRQITADSKFNIERVVFSPQWRRKSIGSLIMRSMLQDIRALNNRAHISLSAQVDAQVFYQNLGFIAEGNPYDDGGIAHITMCCQL